MYDSIFYKCPKCKERLEFQSNAGKCNFEEYNRHEVPIVVAIDINGQKIKCKCGMEYKIVACYLPVTVPMNVEFIEKDEGD